MTIDAEFTVKIKMSDMFVNNNMSGQELRKFITEEGEKRLRYYFSGYLLDPENKIIDKDVKLKPKEQ